MTEVVEDPELPRCINGPDECDGKVEYRLPLSDTGKSFARCDGHWAKRMILQADLRQRIPDTDVPPADFDPLYAGERWNEDD